MDVSIVDEKHRSNVRMSLSRALTNGNGVLTKKARLQIVQEELSKLIEKDKVQDEDDAEDFD